MKGYRESWDDTNKKFVLEEFELKNQYDNDSLTSGNLSDMRNSYYELKESAENAVAMSNTKLNTGAFHVLKCKDCGKFFILPQSEIEWFEQRSMVPPKRCSFCRGKKKTK